MIDDVLAAYGFGAASVEPIPIGLINATYLVRDETGAPAAVAQRLHPVFGAEVNRDIDAITAHLDAKGLYTPRVLRTARGALWLERDDGVWRLLSFVEGVTVERVDHRDRARNAGQLVGRFHRALDDLEHAYAFRRLGVHDTAAHLERLRGHVADATHAEATELGRQILEAAAALPPLGELPERHCHGDLKISNVMFAPGDTYEALCLVDLDTLAPQTIAYELGDALRSWCNRSGEDVTAAAVDLDILEAAMQGYASGARGLLDETEIDSIVTGLHTVCVELAARFCTDAFEDRYFGWDATKYASRVEHNLVRARGQLALGNAVGAVSQEATRLTRAAFSR